MGYEFVGRDRTLPPHNSILPDAGLCSPHGRRSITGLQSTLSGNQTILPSASEDMV